MAVSFDEFRQKLLRLKERGYIETWRMGNTGVGHTLEQEIGLIENNISGPDLIDIEVKSQRRGVSNRFTLFTFNRGVWKIKQKELIEKYGYVDQNIRKSLYCTVSTKPNPQGFYFRVTEKSLELLNLDGFFIAEWEIKRLMETFNAKMPNLIMVIADFRLNSNGREEFWYNEAYYLKGKNEQNFLNHIREGIILVDIRMHIKESGSVRNHGTGFRVDEKYIADYFNERISLLG